MFKLVTYNNNLIKSAFTGINQIVPEVQIELDTDGLRLNALDQAHITFVHLELEADAFDTYELDEPLAVSISTNGFMKVLGRCKPKDTLILEADESDLTITFEGDATRTFKIRLIDLEYEAPTPPSIDYDFSIEIPATLLKDVLSDIGVFSDKLRIRREPEENYILIDGSNDFGTTTTKYETEIEGNSRVDSTYTLEKIKDFMKSEKFGDEIQLKTGEDLPLILEFSNPDGVLSYLLAPRIEQEE